MSANDRLTKEFAQFAVALQQKEKDIKSIREVVVQRLSQLLAERDVASLQYYLEVPLTDPDLQELIHILCAQFLERAADLGTLKVIEKVATTDASPEVREACVEAISGIPKRAGARNKFNLACELLWNFQNDEAMAYFKDAIDTEPEGPYAGLSRALTFYAQKRYDDALSELNAVASDWTWLSDTFIHLGQTYRLLGLKYAEYSLSHFQSALNCYDKAIELDKTALFPYIGKSRVYLNLHRNSQYNEKEAALRDAENCIATVLEREPNYPPALMEKAQHLSRRSEISDSSKQEGLEGEISGLVEQVLKSNSSSKSLLSYAWGSKGLAAFNSRRFREAEECLLRSKQLSKENTSWFIFRHLQDAQKNLGKIDEAAETCREWSECEAFREDWEQQAWAFGNWGNVLKHKKPEDALVYFNKAVELGSSSEKLMTFVVPKFADILKKKDPIAALNVLYTKAPRNAREHPQTKWLLGVLHKESTQDSSSIERALSAGLTPTALSTCKQRLVDAQKKDPYNTLAWTVMGRIENDLKTPLRAVACFERALELDPENAVARGHLGISLKNLGKLDEAIRELETAHQQSNGELSIIENALKAARLEQNIQAARKIAQGQGTIRFFNVSDGMFETHDVGSFRAFVDQLRQELPIGQKLGEIGDSPVFLRAATGVGKTVAMPMHIWLKMWDRGIGGTTMPQVFVVEPRIPIAIDEMHHMNETYQRFLNETHTGASRGQNPFGCITSLGAMNPEAPAVFVTTGILEKKAFEDDFDSEKNRIIIDEAHITLERNPGVEIACGICRRKGVLVDFMSATIDWGSIQEDLGIQTVDCSEQRFQIEYRNCLAKLDEALPSLVDKYLVKREDISPALQKWDQLNPGKRPVGMLVVVNSHQSEQSDTSKYMKLIKSKVPDVEVLVLASPIIRNRAQKRDFEERLAAIQERNRKYVIISTNVVEMGITYPSLDFVVTMDTEYVNVEREGGLTLELAQLGVNALFQRAGRCGRKRPGMCFITRDFNEGQGAWYASFPNQKLNPPDRDPKFVPEPIRYPLLSGSLQKLALLSFIEGVDESHLCAWLTELKLPSHLEKNAERLQKLKEERLQFVRQGLANNARLTPLGEDVLRYVGVEDMSFARMAAMCENPEIRPILITIAALANYSLEDILQQSASLQNDEKTDEENRKAKLTALRGVGFSSELGANPEELVTVLNGRDRELKGKLLSLGVKPVYVSEILNLLRDGYRPRTWLEVTGSKPSLSRYKNRQDFEKACADWETLAKTNRDILHMQKEVVTLDSGSELLAVYDIVSYFFNKYQPYLEEDPPNYLSEELDGSLTEETGRLGVKKHILKNAVESVKDLFEYLREEMPIRKTEADASSRPSPFELRELLKHYISKYCRDANVSESIIAYRLATELLDPLTGKANLRPKPELLNRLESQLQTPRNILSMMLFHVLRPAWNDFSKDWKLLKYSEYFHYLPPLTPLTRHRAYEHIVGCGYGQKWDLMKGGFGYFGEADLNETKLRVEFNTGRTSLSISGKTATFLGKTRLHLRPDGKEYLGLTHVTCIRK